jgi:hypothetical protein
VHPKAEKRWRDFVQQLRVNMLEDVVIAVFTVDEPDLNCVHEDEVARIAQIVKNPADGLPNVNTMVIYTSSAVLSPGFRPEASHDWVSFDAYGDFEAWGIESLFTKLKALLHLSQRAVVTADGHFPYISFYSPVPLTEEQQRPFIKRAGQYYALAQDHSVVALLVWSWGSTRHGSPSGSGGLTAFSDHGGWKEPKYYSMLQFADIDGDGKADVCGRGKDELACFLANIGGPGFPSSGSGSVGVREMPLVKSRWQAIGTEIVR